MYSVRISGLKVSTTDNLTEAFETMANLLGDYKKSELSITIS